MLHVIRLFLLTVLVGLLAACSGESDSTESVVFEQDNTSSQTVAQPGAIPEDAVVISIVYAPESELYLPQAIADFNSAFASGINPVTGAALADGERPIYVEGRQGSSGTVMQGIVNVYLAPNNENVERPVIFAPSVSHWLALVNYETGREVFMLNEARPTALAPVVMAIWESRLNAIRDTVAARDGLDPAEVEIGWEELLEVLYSANGWQDYGIENGRRTVYYGHTDPYISSTALSTLIAEFYAAARTEGFTGRRLTLNEVNDPAVQDGVRRIEQLIRHYSRRTTEFKEYIAQGPDYLDFVALEENDLIYINEGKTEYRPPERLVALYPKEGTFWHEHPFGIVNPAVADWVTPEQAEAAVVFTDYVLMPEVQRRVMEQGFRPANPDVELGYPFVPENGVTPEGPRTVIDVPAPEVIAAVQQSWSFVKKQADIWLLIDVSGSMAQDGRLDQAKQAALAFLDNMETSNRVGLAVFSDEVEVLVPMQNFESIQATLRETVSSLETLGGTELYLAVQQIVNEINTVEDVDRIRAVVLLSDGEDTGDTGVTLNDAVNAVSASRDALNPVILIPVAYGGSADIRALNALARASNTRVQSGDPASIQAVLEIISSYF
ncbi:MAG: VWA domain-containing protein [Chloroflexota bacterium]